MSLPDSIDPAALSVAPASLRGRWLARLDAAGSYPRWVLFAALAGMFATTFPITILTISLSSIATEFGVRETTMAWVITAPMLCSAVALPLLGKLGDLRGHRKIFLTGFVLSTAAAGATALAWDVSSLIGIRTLAAAVGAATGPTSMALIFSVYDRDERVRAMGWWSMTGAAAPALGLIAGGPLVDLLGWRIVFVLQAVFSLFALALAAFVLRETPRQRVRFDFAGAFTLALGVGGLMLALGRVRDVGLLAPEIGVSLLVGALGVALFVTVERRAAEPLLRPALLSQRSFTAPMLSNAFMGAAYMGAFVIAPLVLLKLFERSISEAAAIMLLRTATLTLCSPLGGRLGMRFGERPAALVGAAVMTVALATIAYGVLQSSLVLFGVGLVLQGAGHGLALPSLSSAVASAVPDEELGIASASNRLTAQVGTAFGITALTILYGGDGTPEAFARAFALGTLLSLASLIAASAMARHPVAASREADGLRAA